MIHTLNAPTWVKSALIACALLAAILVWSYLAAFIFLLGQSLPIELASPLTLYQYWYYYGEEQDIQNWLFIAVISALAVFLVVASVVFKPSERSLFGDARFATMREVTKAGMLGASGIICGVYGGMYLMFDGMQHVLLSAPTRSGKGVGVAVPNLLNWPESVVVSDIKQELWDITSGFRAKHGHACYLFNPTASDYRTHCYNPLSYVSEDPIFRIDDVQKIANMLYPDIPGVDVIWTASPRLLFVGITLYLLETPDKPVTLGQVLRESLSHGDCAGYFAQVIKDREKNNDPLSPTCVRSLNSYISIAAETTRTGILQSFRSRLELWSNPLVDAATSSNDFDLRDVRKKKMSIYLGITPDNLERVMPLMSIFYQQLVDLNTRKLPHQDKGIKHTCLLLMDEFTAMGRIPALAKGISYIAGYGLRMLVIFQNPSQLDEVYGRDTAENFKANHALQIVFPPKPTEIETAKKISEWLGYQTVKGRSESKAKGILRKKNPSENISDQRRALLLPQEITGLKKGRALVVTEDIPPILATKITYYNDKTFVDRLKSVSPSLAALKRKIPSQTQLETVIHSGELSAKVSELDIAAYMESSQFSESVSVVFAEAKTEAQIKTSDFSVDEAIKIDSFALKDFAVNFDDVPPPKGGRIDVEEMDKYINSMCAAAGI